MKAIVFDGKELVFHADYQKPRSGESLVRVTLAGICGTDLEILHGYMKYEGIPGHEFVGVVEESENKDLIGRRVVGEINAGCGMCQSCQKGLERHCSDRTVLGILGRNGAFAQYLSLPEKNLHVIPDSVTDEQAVFVEPLAAAFEIKEQVRINPDWCIAVVGDGRLAQLISAVLLQSSKHITCFGRHQNKLARLQGMGVRTKIGTDIDDKQTFDLVVEASGSDAGFTDAMKLVKPRGTVIFKSTTASKNSLDLAQAVINEITMVGSRCGLFAPAINALVTGMISVDDLVDGTFPLEQCKDAFERAKNPKSMKVLLRP